MERRLQLAKAVLGVADPFSLGVADPSMLAPTSVARFLGGLVF